MSESAPPSPGSNRSRRIIIVMTVMAVLLTISAAAFLLTARDNGLSEADDLTRLVISYRDNIEYCDKIGAILMSFEKVEAMNDEMKMTYAQLIELHKKLSAEEGAANLSPVPAEDVASVDYTTLRSWLNDEFSSVSSYLVDLEHYIQMKAARLGLSREFTDSLLQGRIDPWSIAEVLSARR